MSFHTAHGLVSRAVKELDGRYDAEAMSAIIERELPASTKQASGISRADILKSLSASNFVAVRRIPGGPASEALDPEILRAREQIAADRQWLATAKYNLESARALTRQECDALVQRVSRS